MDENKQPKGLNILLLEEFMPRNEICIFLSVDIDVTQYGLGGKYNSCIWIVTTR